MRRGLLMGSFLLIETQKEVSLRDKAYRIIRNKIVTCEFPPGSPLPLLKLSEPAETLVVPV